MKTKITHTNTKKTSDCTTEAQKGPRGLFETHLQEPNKHTTNKSR